jgi:DNA-binding LacI/PurR family transcriptional regulator
MLLTFVIREGILASLWGDVSVTVSQEKQRKITIGDVAEKAETSVSTVSRVLSNPWYPVAKETRERVLQAVCDSGYKSGPGSRYSKKAAAPDIGIILPNISNPFYSMAFLGIEKEFRNTGCNILMYNSFRDSGHEYNLLRSLQQKGIEWVIISSVMQDSSGLRRFTDQGMKLIFLDQKVDDMGNHISFEYKEGAYNAVNYLWRLGHRDISLAMTPLTRWSRREILAGYKEALEDIGVKFKKEMLLLADNEQESEIEEDLNYEIKSGCVKARELLERRPKSTAVLCVNDMVAFGLIRELNRCKVKVPEDISVIGIDDNFFASMFSPALTTVRCPAIEIGQLAAQLLRQQMNGIMGSGFGMKLGSQLVIRESSSPPGRRKVFGHPVNHSEGRENSS